jgi:hypothetical protein
MPPPKKKKEVGRTKTKTKTKKPVHSQKSSKLPGDGILN